LPPGAKRRYVAIGQIVLGGWNMARRDWDRRELIAGICASACLALFAEQAGAATGLGGAFSDILGRATDSSLDRLAQPGAFYNDPAVRIGLPMLGGQAGGLGNVLGRALDAGQRLGLTDNLIRKLNDAAGIAAREAKPVFRNSISRLTLADVPDIARQNDGASQYLRRSAGDELHGKLRPLVDAGLAQVGAYRQLDAVAKQSSLIRAAGLSRDGLGRTVTEQALNGIFRYIGGEEARLRANPLGTAGGVLKGILGN